MKLLIYILITGLFSFSNIFGQQKNENEISRIVYKKSTYKELDLNDIKNPKIRESIKAVNDIIKKIEYELLFDNNKSIYRLVKNLDIKDDSPINILAKGFKEIYYKNLKTNEKLRYSESTGKGFNIILNFNQYEWTITKETKKIGDYLCYKATTFYKDINLTKEFNPIVWFTLDIPVPYGPKGFDGLPGLVLEATNNGQTFYYASLIELNKYHELEIVKPNGKMVTEKEYNVIMKASFSRRN